MKQEREMPFGSGEISECGYHVFPVNLERTTFFSVDLQVFAVSVEWKRDAVLKCSAVGDFIPQGKL